MPLPLFKSHFSIGRSILTLDSPTSAPDPEGPDSVFKIAASNNLKEVVLVEDTFMGFLEARKTATDLGINLIFGLRFNIRQDVTTKADVSASKCTHKIIIFPQDSVGCKALNKIYTKCYTEHEGWLDLPTIRSLWDDEHLSLAIPFYDSFIFKNLTSFDACIPDFSFTSPTFFVENNGLPFDSLVEQGVEKYCKNYDCPIEQTQSIYYKEKDNFSAYLTYKLICSRSLQGGRPSSLERPNFNHLGSDQFCWESYLEKYESA
jgi:DNA polymerase III alpha subunit